MSQPLSNLAPDYNFEMSDLQDIRTDIKRSSIIPIPRSNAINEINEIIVDVEPIIIEPIIIEPIIMEPQQITVLEVTSNSECIKKVPCNDPCIKKDPCNDPCVKKDPCNDPCKTPCNDPCHDPCNDPCNNNSGWEWLGYFVLWFIVFTVLFWLIYYSLKPPFVLQSDSSQVDTAKVLLAAVISAFILIIIVWLIKAAIGK